MKLTSSLITGALSSAFLSLGLIRAAVWCDPLRAEQSANQPRSTLATAPFTGTTCQITLPA